jgi:invasion protein IalB
MSRKSLLPLLVCAIVNTSAFAQSSSVIYSPWTKFCLKDAGGTTCFVGRDARTVCDVPIAGVVLVEREGNASATLRMTLPPPVNRDHAGRIIVDQDEPISRPFKECDARSCAVEQQEPALNLVARLKSGRTIAVHGVGANNQALIGTFPLAGFAEAYDGPSSKPQIFEMSQKDLQAELERRRKAAGAGEPRKPEGC